MLEEGAGGEAKALSVADVTTASDRTAAPGRTGRSQLHPLALWLGASVPVPVLVLASPRMPHPP